MSKAKNGDTVKVHYTGTLDDGRIVASSGNHEPFEFTLGEGQLIKGFEDAVIGMSAGETKTVKVPPEEAFGPHRNELIVTFDKADFPPGIEPREGLALNLTSPDGKTVEAAITEISGDSVTLDANHPLAGKDLIFKIDLVEIA